MAALAALTLSAAACASARTSRSAAPDPSSEAGLIGWKSFERLDLLPDVRPGVRAFQTSSADPTGHDDDGFTGRYSCRRRVAQGCLLAEHHGPGELEAVWTAGNQVGSVAAAGKLMIELDGRMVLDDTWPELVSGHVGNPFIFPLVLSQTESWGGASVNVPMPFRREMRVISQFNPHYFHVVFRTFPTADGIAASGPPLGVPHGVETELLDAGTRDPKPRMGAPARVSGTFRLGAGRRLVLANLSGSGAITQLRLRFTRYLLRGTDTVERAAMDVFRGARVRISFDGVRTVDAPLGEFFGSGLGPTQVRSLMFAMDGDPIGWASTWWPMPFASSAQIELDNASRTAILRGQISVSWARNRLWEQALGRRADAGYFHAQGHRGLSPPGSLWTLLKTRGSGTFVGTTMTMEGGSPPFYMEGNERAYVNGATPQIQGTGTEDFFGGGWYFFDHLFSLPLTGYTAHQTSSSGCPKPTCKSMYRIMIDDAVPFSRSILYQIQNGAGNGPPAIYSSTTYWYQRRSAR
jgi:hypothetical protein